jgi:hypothetical protein
MARDDRQPIIVADAGQPALVGTYEADTPPDMRTLPQPRKK